MECVFKIGDHCFSGASLYYIKPAKTYTLMITFCFCHISIDMKYLSTRLAFSIGDHEVFFRIQVGLGKII